MSTTSNDPDQIREQIEVTRGRLSQDVNALAENARPSTIVRRRVGRVRSSFSGVRHRLMGSSHEDTYGYQGYGRQAPGSSGYGYEGLGYEGYAPGGSAFPQTSGSASGSSGGSVTDTARSAVDSVTGTAQQAPTMVRERTEGNPLAVGLIAFGIGWLAGSLAPATEVEQHAAERVKEQAQPLAQKAGEVAKEAAQEMKENLQEPAQEAVRSVQESAGDAASTVKDEAGSAARQTGSRSS